MVFIPQCLCSGKSEGAQNYKRKMTSKRQLLMFWTEYNVDRN